MAKKSTPPQRKNSIPDQNYTVKHDAQLLEYMIEIWPHQSRSAIKSYLAHRQIAINGKTETAFDLPLRAGDRLTWRSVGEERQNPNHKVKIIYEDDHIIVVDKKPGVLTMSTGREGEQTAYSVMMEHVRRRNKNNRIFIVHRLDRDTSGLLLFAKSEEIQEILHQIQLDKRPFSPGTSREASGVPCLNPRRRLTLLSPVCRDPAIGV